jgi:hypothetical protein
MFPLFLEAAWQVTLAALLLGAGLPVLFALGVRSFAVAGTGEDGVQGANRILLRTAGLLCFVLIVAAVAIGLTIIVATGFGKEVSFEQIVPMIVDKED